MAYKRTFRKRAKKGAKQRRSRRARIYKAPYIIPKQLIVRCPYVETDISLDPGAGTMAAYKFRANSCYDPNQTGAGHQPMMFDTYMNMYNNFQVLSSIMIVEWVNVSATAAQKIGVSLLDTTSSLADLSQYQEQKRTYSQLVGRYDGNKTWGKLISRYSMKKYYGAKASSLSQFVGTSSSDVSEQAYYHVWLGGLQSVVDPGAVIINVKINYLVKFTEPKSLSGS